MIRTYESCGTRGERSAAGGRRECRVLSRIDDSRLRQAVAGTRSAWEDRVETGNGKLCLEDNGCHGGVQPLHVEFPDVECVKRRAIRGISILLTDNRRRATGGGHSPPATC